MEIREGVNGEVVCFKVLGEPQPQGSTRGFYNKALGRVVTTTSNKALYPWRNNIMMEASKHREAFWKDGKHFYELSVDFYFNKPPSAPKSRLAPNVKPDLDKLLRGVMDAMKGTLIGDDAEVVSFKDINKCYGQPMTVIHLRRLA